MLAKLSSNSSELLRLLKESFEIEFQRNNLPIIPIEYGKVTQGGGLEFSPTGKGKILLHPKLSEYLQKPINQKYTGDAGKVTYMLEAVGHELTHYIQFLRGRPLSESEAYPKGERFSKYHTAKLSKKEINPTLVVPIKSKEQLEHLFKAQSQLIKAGVTFDSGTRLSPRQRHWELDWSLKGGSMKNPRKRELSVPEKHQLKIAKKTLTYSDVGARIMGGPTKAEAREIIKRLTGRTPKGNPSKKWHEKQYKQLETAV